MPFILFSSSIFSHPPTHPVPLSPFFFNRDTGCLSHACWPSRQRAEQLAALSNSRCMCLSLIIVSRWNSELGICTQLWLLYESSQSQWSYPQVILRLLLSGTRSAAIRLHFLGWWGPGEVQHMIPSDHNDGLCKRWNSNLSQTQEFLVYEPQSDHPVLCIYLSSREAVWNKCKPARQAPSAFTVS